MPKPASVRPRQIFQALKKPAHDREIRMKLSEADDLRPLETCLLMTALEMAQPQSIFEFGTYRGATTLNLALNAPKDARVWTFDVDPAELPLDPAPGDSALTQIHLQARTALAFVGSPVEHKITRLQGDSQTARFPQFEGVIDFIFVDGGHDLTTLEADTKNSLRMLRAGGVIAWHDYGNPDCPYVASYLDRLSARVPMVHVEE